MTSSGSGPDIAAVVQAVEQWLLQGSRDYTRTEVVEHVDISAEEARALWRALGFPTVADDERVFTDADIEALRNVRRLEEIGDIDADVMRAMTRIIGQSFARLVSWQGQVVIDILAARPELLADGSPDRVLSLVEELTPVVGALHDYVWRRQFAAYFSRVAATTGVTVEGARDTARAGVGFVDMAEFTLFTRRSSDAELRAVLDDFEALATEIAGDWHGQIVKTIGDEVLFVADDPGAAAEIATTLVERSQDLGTLPTLRAGVAYGPVVWRLGDVFGQTVNIASRLVGVARPGSVLVDGELAEELTEQPQWTVHQMRPVSVRGYRHLHAARLRRAPDRAQADTA